MTDEASVNRQRIVDLQGFGNWVDDPVFSALRQALSCRRHETLSLLELFGGLSSGSIAALCLGFTNTVQSGYVDIETGLLRFIRRLHGLEFIEKNCSRDVMSLSLDELPQVDLLLAGPPCPPWSKQGVRKSWNDPRSKPFFRTLEIIAHLARRGLKSFIIENVIGFMQMQSDGIKPVDTVLKELRDTLPAGWEVDVHIYDSLDFCIPQSRPRAYVTGRKGCGACPPHIAKFHWRGKLSDIIDFSASAPDGSKLLGVAGNGYSLTNQQNVLAYKMALRSDMFDPEMHNKVACFAYDRTPSSRTRWNPDVNVEYSQCVTTHVPLHFLSLGTKCGLATGSAQCIDRAALVSEYGALQGFPKWYLCDENDRLASVCAIGNAMSVPVLASVMARELLHMFRIPMPDLSAAYSGPEAPIRTLGSHKLFIEIGITRIWFQCLCVFDSCFELVVWVNHVHWSYLRRSCMDCVLCK